MRYLSLAATTRSRLSRPSQLRQVESVRNWYFWKNSSSVSLSISIFISSAIPVLDILDGLQDSARVRLIGFSWEFASVDAVTAFYDTLDKFRGLDENGGNLDQAQVSATIHVPSATAAQIEALRARYPYITVTAG